MYNETRGLVNKAVMCSKTMREVSKKKFKEVFLEYGKASDGWGAEYWQRFFEVPKSEGMKYLVELPSSKEQSRMM